MHGSSNCRPQAGPASDRRVDAYVDEVCDLDDPRSRGKALTGDLAGYWRYRIGDFRVLVEIRDAELVIIAFTLGHRLALLAVLRMTDPPSPDPRGRSS